MTLGELLLQLINQGAIPSAAQHRVAQGNELLGHGAAQTTGDSGDHDYSLSGFVIDHSNKMRLLPRQIKHPRSQTGNPGSIGGVGG
jgi:hypothetical protein